MAVLIPSLVFAHDKSRPEQIADGLFESVGYDSLSPENPSAVKDFVCNCLRMSDNSIDDIRAGLVIYQKRVAELAVRSPSQAATKFINAAVFLKLLFVRPAGLVRDLPPSRLWFRDGDGSPNPDEPIEYCRPWFVERSGRIRLRWFEAGFAGHVSFDIVRAFDEQMAKWPRRKIDYSGQDCERVWEQADGKPKERS